MPTNDLFDFSDEDPTLEYPGGRCPPHLLVLSHDDRLVCDVCERPISVCCLGCVVEHDGFLAVHVCEDDSEAA
jgi:hypothetical protein